MEQLFVVGGSGPWFEGCVPFAQSLELSSRCWQSLPSMAIARSHCAAVGAEDCLLVLGGQDGHPLDVVEALLSPGDIASCSWECRKPLPEALSDCSALYHPSLHRLVLLGHPRGTSARLQIRDAACGTWKSWKLPSERWNPALAQCSRYLPVQDLPLPRCGSRSSRWLVIGGLSLEDEDVGSVDVFDLRTNAWSELRLPELLQPRSSAMACGTTSGRIFVLGGQQVGPVEYVEALDLWDCAWRRCADLPEPFACRATAIAAMD
ncbi:Kelch domain-containing protein 8B [Durusdinium trenchii]